MFACSNNKVVRFFFTSSMTLKGSQGFTLIELLVVLVVVGASSAFVGPNLWKQYAKSTERSVVQNVALEVQSLRRESFMNGKMVSFKIASERVNQILPSGWKISDFQPIYFLPSGVTNGGVLIFTTSSGTQWKLILSPLDGRSKIDRL